MAKIEDVTLQINGSEDNATPGAAIRLEKRELWVGSDGSLWVGNPKTGTATRIKAGDFDNNAASIDDDTLKIKGGSTLDLSGASMTGEKDSLGKMSHISMSQMYLNNDDGNFIYGTEHPDDVDDLEPEEGMIYFQMVDG